MYLRLRLANKQAASSFVYLFTHKVSASLSELYSNGSDHFYGTSNHTMNRKINCKINIWTNFTGISHGDELPYLYPTRGVRHMTTLPTKEDEQIQKAMIKMWVDFARTGWESLLSEIILNWGVFDVLRNSFLLKNFVTEIQRLKLVPCRNGKQ